VNQSFKVTAGRVYSLSDEKGSLFVVDPNGTFGEETIIAFASLEEAQLPAPKSRSLGDRDSVGASQFAADVKQTANRDRVASVLVRFFSVK
jgi:hypothetical protein